MRSRVFRLAVMTLLLIVLFAGQSSVRAVPPPPPYFNLTQIQIGRCASDGGILRYFADVSPGGASATVRWFSGIYNDQSGVVDPGSRTITAIGSIYGSVTWSADDTIFWESYTSYAVFLDFQLYRGAGHATEILDTAAVSFTCTPNGATNLHFHNN